MHREGTGRVGKRLYRHKDMLCIQAALTLDVCLVKVSGESCLLEDIVQQGHLGCVGGCTRGHCMSLFRHLVAPINIVAVDMHKYLSHCKVPLDPVSGTP